MKNTIVSIVLFFSAINLWEQDGFVKVKNTQFEIDGKPYHYLGANFWQAMNLASKGNGGDRTQLLSELDHLADLGIKNLRIMAGSEGPNTEPYRIVPALQTSPGVYDEDILDGLDFVLAEMGKRDMKAVMCLTNFWPWSGGMAQYIVWANEADSIPYPPPHPSGSWTDYQKFTAKFYSSKKAVQIFNDHVTFILNRTNTYTQKKYTDDNAIMSWELGNEPRAVDNYKDYYTWIKKTSDFIKNLDNNHLVTIGSEGYTSNPTAAGNQFSKDHAYKNIDYTCTHIWIQNFSWYDPINPEKTYFSSLNKAADYLDKHIKEAKQLNKPLVLEEFGCARDSGSYDPTSQVTYRNHYFHTIFEKVYQNNDVVAGVAFWAWAGANKPKSPYGMMWSKGDPIIGDPPHELQGWYSVYDTDYTTLSILKVYAEKFSTID